MRLWHKNLIPYLPRQQLLGQWRECCAIAKSIAEKGTPNHILVNKIMDYPLEQFYQYGCLIAAEMNKRHYYCDLNKFSDYIEKVIDLPFYIISEKDIFPKWHDYRYLKQCLYNLQEKYDCGGISDTEWEIIQKNFWDLVKKYK